MRGRDSDRSGAKENAAERRVSRRHAHTPGGRPQGLGARGQAAASLHDTVGNRGALHLLRSATVAHRDEGAAAADAARTAAAGPRAALPHRREAERALGADLSHVQAATGPAAQQACDTIGAAAFNVGNLVVFGNPHPDPKTVIHEATHALQQPRGQLGAVPDRLPVAARHDAVERAADAREAGHPAPAAGARGSVFVALKPKPGEAGITKGDIPLLEKPGGKAKARLSPGTRVKVASMVGPAYSVVVESGPAAGQSGILPSYSLDDAPKAPATPTPETPTSETPTFGSTLSISSPARDPSILSDSELQSEINATDGWLFDNKLDIKRAEMEAYSLALRAEYQRRRPSVAAGGDEPPFPGAIKVMIGDKPFYLMPNQAGPRSVPSGAQVMGNEYFGGETWVYTDQSKVKLPINWKADPRVRGIQAEPIITQQFYSQYNPVVLPRSFEAYDLSIGGKREAISGSSWLLNPLTQQVEKTPWAGWEITNPVGVGLKTVDVTSPMYWSISKKPWSVDTTFYEFMSKYVEEIASAPRVLGKTDVFRAPGQPRFHVTLVDVENKLLHLQLRDEPNAVQADDLQRVREEAASIGVRVVIYGPPGYGKSTVINTAGAPAPAYINTTPPLTVDPKFESRQAIGQGSLLVAQAAFGVLNDIGSSIQQEEAQKSYQQELANVQKVLKDQPDMGASIWITWYRSNAPWFSVNQPGPMFGGVRTVYEREPSDSPGAGLYKSNPGGISNQRVWIPPSAPREVSAKESDALMKRIDGTLAWIKRLQTKVDEYAGEGKVERAWVRRRGTVSPHTMDEPRYHEHEARTLHEKGRYTEAEAELMKARELLRKIEGELKFYEGPPWWSSGP